MIFAIDEEKKRKKTWSEMSAQEKYALMNSVSLDEKHDTEFLRNFNQHWRPSSHPLWAVEKVRGPSGWFIR